MITGDVQIFPGLNVGKTDHWEYALTKDNTKVCNRTLPNDESKPTTGQ